MANTYLKPEQYVNLTLARLWQSNNLSGLVTPYSGEAFIGARDDTLIYKTKGVTVARDYEFRTRTAPIVFDEIYRNSLSLTLDQHMTVGNRWTDEERTFDLTSMDSEIATPMAEAMVVRFDSKIAAGIAGADWAITNLNGTAAGTTTAQAVLELLMGWKQKLDAAGTPARGRRLVLGSNPFLHIATSEAVTKYDPAQALTVFQEGVFGKAAGFDIIDGTQIIGENDILAVHPSWAILANAAPENVPSLSFCERGTYGGFSIRLAAQYDINYASERLLLNTFWGLNEIKDQYARHSAASAAAANDGSSKGDIIIEDGKTKFTGKNVRGGSGQWTP